MTLDKLIVLLNEDLSREYAHMHFYLHAAAVVTGLHREEYQELFMKEAASEMQHVHEFGKMILGLGGIPGTAVAPFYDGGFSSSNLSGSTGVLGDFQPKTLLTEALRMEQEVVANYTQRMDEAEELDGEHKVHGRYVHIFLEDQILDSRAAVDQYKEMLKGM